MGLTSLVLVEAKALYRVSVWITQARMEVDQVVEGNEVDGKYVGVRSKE